MSLLYWIYGYALSCPLLSYADDLLLCAFLLTKLCCDVMGWEDVVNILHNFDCVEVEHNSWSKVHKTYQKVA